MRPLLIFWGCSTAAAVSLWIALDLRIGFSGGRTALMVAAWFSLAAVVLPILDAMKARNRRD